MKLHLLVLAAPFVPSVFVACGDGDALPQEVADAAGGGDASDARDPGDGGTKTPEPRATGACAPEPDECDAGGGDSPFRLSEHSATYLEATREMLVFGGSNAVAEGCNIPAPDYHGETWLFDDRCGQWLQVDVEEGPSPRARHAMTYGAGVAWMFGGRYAEDGSTSGEYQFFGELWTFDPATREWTEVTPDGELPPPRANTAVAWDDERGRLWLWGGNALVGGTPRPAADLWYYDPGANSWSQVATEASPPARLYHSLLYDERRDRLVLYGGADSNFVGLTGIWGLDPDLGRWQRLDGNSEREPDGRYWGALVDDPDEDRYLLFGGHDSTDLGNRNDWWSFDPGRREWLSIQPGDELNSSARGFCDFPPDFATVDLAAPERRNAHSMVWSASCGHGLLFAGKTDCGATDDVWELSASNWRKRTRATEGEVCVRWRDDPGDCSNICN